MSIYETSIKNPKKIIEFYKQLSEQKDIEIKQLKEQLQQKDEIINKAREYIKNKKEITSDFSEELDDMYYIGKTRAYEEILSKIEKSDE